MTTRDRKFFPVLNSINRLGDKVKRKFVRRCDKKILDCISECAKNVIKGNVPLTSRQKTRLRRSRNDLRALSVKKTSAKKTSHLAEGWISQRTTAAGVGILSLVC